MRQSHAAIRPLSEAELDAVGGGTSQFIAAVVATLYNTIDPGAHCVAADHKVACENPPRAK